jgi:hypothetical protein
LSDVWDAIKIEGAGNGSAKWGPGGQYATFDEYNAAYPSNSENSTQNAYRY